MTNLQSGSVSLIGATLAGAVAFLLIPSGLLWMASLLGLILLLVLLAYEGSQARSTFQTIAFSAVCGLSLTLASLGVYEYLLQGIAPPYAQLIRTWLPLTYLGATLLMLVVNFARSSGSSAAVPQAGSFYVPTTPTAVAAPSYSKPAAAAPVMPEVPPSTVPASPIVTSTRPPVAVPLSEPTEPRLVRNSEPIQPSPEAVPIKPGKETSIYVNLLGEGLNMLRPVRAEHLGRDYYRILEPVPENEQWEYGPGQIVRCRKKNLSSGKAMVAVEEAPRAQ